MFTRNAAAVATSLEELLYFFGWIYFSVKKNKIKNQKRILEAVANREKKKQTWYKRGDHQSERQRTLDQG